MLNSKYCFFMLRKLFLFMIVYGNKINLEENCDILVFFKGFFVDGMNDWVEKMNKILLC